MNTEFNKTENNGQLHVVLGVNGNSGQKVAQELVNQGYNVRGISRSGKGPEGIITIKADALNYEQLKQAIEGASVVYHCLGIPYSEWAKKYPIIMNNLIEAATVNGTEKKVKIVFADNLYAFGEEGARLGPMNEDTPQIASEKKGILRKKLTAMLFEADKEGKIISVVSKASDFFGPGATNSITYIVVKQKILQRRPVGIFGNLDSKHSYIYLQDFARSLVTLGTSENANSQSWILPHYEAVSIRKFFEDFYTENGVNIPKKVKSLPSFILKIIGLFNKDLKEYERVLYQNNMDWIVDDSKFKEAFPEFELTPLKEAYKETYEWFLGNN